MRQEAMDTRLDAGFSLVELLIALVITTIIGGSIFGLIAGGNAAFQREPALTDRQQNVRIAMAMIERDLHTAGQRMGPWVQAIKRCHQFPEPVNGACGTTSATAGFLNARGPGDTDHLEIRGNDVQCPDIEVCVDHGVNLFTYEPIPSCFAPAGGDPGLVYIGPSQGFGYGTIQGGSAGCAGGGHLTFNAGTDPNVPGSKFCTTAAACRTVSKVEVVRYEIAIDTNEATAGGPNNAVPSLYRSPTGGSSTAGGGGSMTGGYVPAPNPAGNWQLVARGIDDLQVQYVDGAGNVANSPPIVVDNTPASLTRQVIVTINGRALGTRLAGQMPAPRFVQNTSLAYRGSATVVANGTTAIRGSLTSRVTPRSALLTLRASGAWR